MEEDGFGIRVYEFDGGTGNAYLYRVMMEYGEFSYGDRMAL